MRYFLCLHARKNNQKPASEEQISLQGYYKFISR